MGVSIHGRAPVAFDCPNLEESKVQSKIETVPANSTVLIHKKLRLSGSHFGAEKAVRPETRRKVDG